MADHHQATLDGQAGTDFAGTFELLRIEDFLDAGTCERLLSEARSSEYAQAGVGLLTETGIEFHVDTTVRKVKAIRVPKSTRAFVVELLTAIKPDLEKHFNIALYRCEKASFLLYNEGDFYVPHTDSEGQELDGRRKISIVIFLNSQTDTPGKGSYSGGTLVFRREAKDGPSGQRGYTLLGRAGLLVAFRSDLLHEVTPVLAGERYTIASWFI